jgi:hypothetical protein
MLTIISQVYKVAASEWGTETLRNPVTSLKLPKHKPGRDRRLEGTRRRGSHEPVRGSLD